MRDPKRIDPILNQLKALWTTYPDLRLGQLMENIKSTLPDKTGWGPDLFNLEDDVMEEVIQKIMREGFGS